MRLLGPLLPTSVFIYVPGAAAAACSRAPWVPPTLHGREQEHRGPGTTTAGGQIPNIAGKRTLLTLP